MYITCNIAYIKEVSNDLRMHVTEQGFGSTTGMIEAENEETP